MKRYRAEVDTKLRAAASLEAPVMRVVARGTKFSGEVVDDLFIKTTDLSPEPGFIDLFDAPELVELPPKPMGAEDDMIFCALVTEAARHIGWLRGSGADRDYLLAVAYDASSNLTDMGSAEEAGPFRFRADEWQAAITTGPARDLGQVAENRLDWNHQPDVAAALAAEAADRFRDGFDRAPTFAELLFVQRLGPGAVDLLRRSRAETCHEAIPGTPPPGSYAAKLKASALTIGQAVGELETHLVAAYAQALPVIDRQPPDIRLVRPAGDEPPWLRIARDEMTRGVQELPGVANEDRISRYHDSAGVKDNRDETPWCGSFVTFCMKTCGDALAAGAVPKDPGRAANWANWAKAAPVPAPLGSVVVLHFPDGGDHVGLLVGMPDADHVRVLGGNQGNPGQVSEVNFRTADVVARQWLTPATGVVSTVEVAGTAAPGPGDELFLAKAPPIMKRLMADFPGMTTIQAAAILGNIGHECMGFKALHQLGMPEKRGGHGWCQWDGTRREALFAFAAKQGRDWKDDEVNYAFLVGELRGSEKKALASLLGQGSLEAAVEDFDRRFERSGVRALDRRLRYAELALAAAKAP